MFLWILGLLALLLVVSAGLTLIKASRDIEAADDSDLGPVADLVDDRLSRARIAVDTLIHPDATLAEVRPSRHAIRERATTYAMFGLGLVGVAVFIAIGLVLLGA